MSIKGPLGYSLGPGDWVPWDVIRGKQLLSLSGKGLTQQS